MSEKANDLLNKFGSAQFDFMVWNTPDNLVARDKARQEISDYIAELELGLNNQTVHSNTLQKILTEKLDRIAELEAAQRWIPVSERLPEDGETVFVIIHDGFERFEKGNEVARLTYLGNGNWWSWERERYVVTHWMPLPQPPEVQE